ncbi:hypothetical protein MKX01_019447 [Papaver californicum]|nr:hypothetical protein MKX01_019447 [Papaver californicum]
MGDQKVVLVTGCAKGGIGYEYCKAFAEQICHVFATDISSRIHQLSDLPTENVKSLELDVTSDESVKSAIAAVINKCGKIDLLVNNAGIGSTGPLAELPLEIVRNTYEVNTLGQLRMAQHVVPYMASRGCGRIAGSYCSSKASVHAMSDTLRVELKPFGIDVILVVPGAIRSNLGQANVERLKDYEWKLYKEFKDDIVERAKASQTGKATDATIFARYVVKKVLSLKPPKQTVFGHMTGLFALLSWSPLWVRDQFFSNRFNLNNKSKL